MNFLSALNKKGSDYAAKSERTSTISLAFTKYDMPLMSPDKQVTGTVQIKNLSKDAYWSDVLKLCKPFGPIKQVYLAKDKHTQQSKGLAFVKYHNCVHAAKAIQSLHGNEYHDHVMLNVEWAKSSPRPAIKTQDTL